MGRPARRRRRLAGRTPMRSAAHDRRPDAAGRLPTGPPTFVNTSTHWWDGSQIYGTDAATTRTASAPARAASSGSSRTAAPAAARTTRPDPTEEPGFWVGLAMLQTLFTLEHNAICDRLRAATTPTWTDDELFERRPPDHRRAARQDPHRRVDAGRHQPPDHGDRACAPTGSGCAGERVKDAVRPHQQRAR